MGEDSYNIMLTRSRASLSLLLIPIIVSVGGYSYLSLSAFEQNTEVQFDGPGLYVQTVADYSEDDPLVGIEIIFYSVSSPDDVAIVPGGGGPIPGGCGNVEVEVVVEPLEPPPGCSSAETEVTNNTGWIVIDSSISEYFLLKIRHSNWPETRLTLASGVVQTDSEQNVYVRISLPSGRFMNL